MATNRETSPGEVNPRVWQHDHDFLSFLAVFLQIYDGISLDLTLATVLLDDLWYGLPDESSRGGSFAITLAPGSAIYDRRTIKDEISGSSQYPKVVALKMPVITSNGIDSAGSRLHLNALAVEVQILRDSQLRFHENIVSLLGVCWQSLTDDHSLILPVLVLEAADRGDLVSFMKSGDGNDFQTQLQLGVDISSGLHALHTAGIIHCDIKPENILVFTNDTSSTSYTAKIADFGSALFLSDSADEVKLHMGTKVWQAPEYGRAIERQHLSKIDIYSMGLVLYFIFGGKHAEDIASWLNKQPDLQRMKQSTEFMLAVLDSLEQLSAPTFTVDDELRRLSEAVRYCVGMTLMPKATDRVDDVLFIAENFRMYLKSLKGDIPSSLDGDMVSNSEPMIRNIRDRISQIDSENTIQALFYSGTLRMLPVAVVDQIWTQARAVADDHLQNIDRRRRSAFDCFVLGMRSLRFPNCDPNHLDTSYHYLSEAASLNDEFSEYLVQSPILYLSGESSTANPAQNPERGLLHKMCTDAAVRIESTLTGEDAQRDLECALIVPCMKGDTVAVTQLLSQQSTDMLTHWYCGHKGMTPLHFLGMFPESDVSAVGALLMTSKADVEARWKKVGAMWPASEKYFSYCQGGTPLLWAVAANNQAACKFLLEHGADPYDVAASKLPLENRWGRNIHISPIHLAASAHLSEILSLLLQARSPSDPNLNVNNCFSYLAGTEGSFLPFYSALDYEGEGVIRRILLHGKNHITACLQTVEVLLQNEANPQQITDGPHSMTALQLAVRGGQFFLVECLLQRKDGILRPRGRELCSILYHIAMKSDDVMLDLFKRYGVITEDDAPNMLLVLPDIVEVTDSLAIVAPLVDKILEAPNAQHDLTESFQQALLAGNLEVASYIFRQSYMDGHRPVSMISVETKNEIQCTWSLIGKLLASSKNSRNLQSRLETLLILMEEHDIAYREESALVTQFYSMTPLHLAANELEYRSQHNNGGDIMDVLLNHFDTRECLNAPTRVNSDINQALAFLSGYTPLHWAVHSGNKIALSRLLDEPDVDKEALSDRGCNAYDIALERFEKDALPHFSGWPILEREKLRVAERYTITTYEIIATLKQHNLMPHKYRLAVAREDDQTVSVQAFAPGFRTVVLTDCDLTRIPDDCDRIMRRVKTLEVGDLVAWATPVETLSVSFPLLVHAIARGNGSCGFVIASSRS